MVQTGIKAVTTDESTIGPDKLIVDPQELVNQSLSVAIGTAVGMSINKFIEL